MLTRDNGMIAVVQHPINANRTFLDAIRLVHTTVGLATEYAETYEMAFLTRYTFLKNMLSWCSAFCLFTDINTWALADVHGLDPHRDDRQISMHRDFLWRTLTGEDPHVAPARQRMAVERLKRLGVR